MRLAQITCPVLTIRVIIFIIINKRGAKYAEIYPFLQAVEKDAAGDQQKQAQKLGQY